MLKDLFSKKETGTTVEAAPLPDLELSGPILQRNFSELVSGCEKLGGVERYVAALKLKSTLFQEALGDGAVDTLTEETFAGLCAFMSTVRRRVGSYLQGDRFVQMREALTELTREMKNINNVDGRLEAFCALFPQNKKHRWVKDLAAEVLHNMDPERYPLMTRWVWDARPNTGVIRELWFDDNIDNITVPVPDGHATYVALRMELGGWLSENGVFQDTIYYVDMLQAQIYANYICAQGGTYLRADFASPQDPTQYVRRLLGLDGIKPGSSQTRLKSPTGEIYELDLDTKLLD